MCGTPEYMAPEVLDKVGHGTCVDWWGLGMLLFEMLTGLPPWYTKDRKQLFDSLRNAPLVFPPHVSREARSIISGLLNRNPAERLGSTDDSEDLKNHPFFATTDWNALLARRIMPPITPCTGYAGNTSTVTSNFDPQFTRLPVESDKDPNAATTEIPEFIG